MTSAARELEIFEKDINAQVVASENRIEKSIMQLQSSIKDMELKLVREMQANKDELGTRINSLKEEVAAIKVDMRQFKGDIKLLKGIGYFIASVATLSGSLLGITIATPKVLAL